MGSALITPGSFKVNGDRATLRQVNRILETAKPDELAGMDIEIKNNVVLENEVRSKQRDAILETQVHETIGKVADRKEMVRLQKELEKYGALSASGLPNGHQLPKMMPNRSPNASKIV